VTTTEVEQLEEGDLITAYRSGYHKFVRAEPRYLTERDFKYSSYFITSLEKDTGKKPEIGDLYQYIIIYQQIADKKGKSIKGNREWSCGSGWCKKVTPFDIYQQIGILHAEIERLEKIIDLI